MEKMSDVKGPAGDAAVVSSGKAQVRKAGFSKKGALVLLAAMFALPVAMADEFDDAAKLFHDAGQSAWYFNHSYAHAVFPSVGKGALIVGAAHGDGKVYRNHKYIGDTSLTQVTVGVQAGGEAFTEIIFFKDKQAFDAFTAGNFGLAADVTAVAITAGASGEAAADTGETAGASGGKRDATTSGSYTHGVAVFTIIKGGAMVQAAVGGQKFSYKPAGG
jgi:lipid-binding SYLF domain-containing protein